MLLENLLVEMNKELIVYMVLIILYMLKIKELMKMLKQMVQFFVLQLQMMVLQANGLHKSLILYDIYEHWSEFQFSVFGTGFSVLVPGPANFNSLYQASDSLKN